ncbi:MAG: hypothetical protein HWE13_14820 [Gammaproteobacteria bacterium]|nr:hypothetical protein [Gammaproteobacteria bacterium]NVK89407.1 hypothetical protein [Gammaproteobacteria bacterium]
MAVQQINAHHRRASTKRKVHFDVLASRKVVLLAIAAIGAVLFMTAAVVDEVELIRAQLDYFLNPMRVVLEPLPHGLEANNWRTDL